MTFYMDDGDFAEYMEGLQEALIQDLHGMGAEVTRIVNRPVEEKDGLPRREMTVHFANGTTHAFILRVPRMCCLEHHITDAQRQVAYIADAMDRRLNL